jgi:hypothetical protein
MTKKQYDNTKERILKSDISDLEKSSQLTNNWFNYIFHSGEKAQNNSLKYEAEKVRINY